MSNRKNRITTFDVINICFLLTVVAVTLLPFIYMINVSISDKIFVLQNRVGLWPKGLTFDAYKVVLGDPRIGTGYKNTITYVLLGTAISLPLTAMGGYAISRNLLFRKSIMIFIVITLMFNGGMIPTYLVVKELGIIDTVWAMTLPGAISVWNLMIMRAFFQGIPNEMLESGRIDGLNDLGVFFRLVIPLSKPVLATIGLFYAVGLWNNFFYALLYIRDAQLFPLQVVLRNMVLTGVNDGNNISSSLGADSDTIVIESLKYATIVVSSLPIILVYPFLQKYFVKGAMIGSVKG